MPGMMQYAPFPMMDSETLAKLAQAGFRPPGMSGPGGMGGGAGGAPGMGLGGAGAALGGLAGMAMRGGSAGDGTRTGNDADLGGYGTAGGMPAGLPNPNGQQYGAGGVPIGPIPAAQGGSFLDFMKSFGGAGAGDSGGFVGGGSSGYGSG